VVALGIALIFLPSQISGNGSASQRAQKAREIVRQKIEALDRAQTNDATRPNAAQ